MKSIFSDLKKDGFINIEYPENVRSSVEETAQAWKNFCAQDKKSKDIFPYTDEGGGYEFKDELGAGKDLKENFHMHLEVADNLAGLAATGSDAAKAFIASGKKLLEDTYNFSKDVLEKIEEESGVVGLAERALRLQKKWTLRFLHYLPGAPVGAEIASTHPDKGCITLHLYESAGGLEYYWKNKWQDMPVGVDYTASIGGMGLQYATKCEIKATNHRVIATEETARDGRYSMVIFMPIADVPGYDKERNGRTQDLILNRGVGFNYDMTFPEFQKLFKEDKLTLG